MVQVLQTSCDYEIVENTVVVLHSLLSYPELEQQYRSLRSELLKTKNIMTIVVHSLVREDVSLKQSIISCIDKFFDNFDHI